MASKYPPKLSLDEAIKVIKSMYAEHQSREISIDLMPEILQTKQSSSFFNDKISALQRFGFVQKMPNDLLYLTDLAMQIINPIGNEDFEAKIQAFNKIDVLSDLMLKYPNGKLPSSDQLQQSLMKVYQISRDRVKNWHDFVTESFRAISGISEKSIYHSASIITKKEETTVNEKPSKDFRLPLPSGKTFGYSIDDGFTADDLDFLKNFFELMKVAVK